MRSAKDESYVTALENVRSVKRIVENVCFAVNQVRSLVKKFVHFRDEARGRETVAANPKLLLYFRPVTSTACSMEKAESLGRQPEIELDTDAVRKMAPKKVTIDHVKGAWRGSYSL